MRVNKPDNGDPVVIGTCAACGHPIYSNEDYYLSDGEMIHAEGVGASAKVPGQARWIKLSCLFLHLNEESMEDEAAKLFGIERVKV